MVEAKVRKLREREISKEIKMSKPSPKYIKDLVSNLIGENPDWKEIFQRDPQKFRSGLKNLIRVFHVDDMNAATLGRILCSFQLGEVEVNNLDIFTEVRYSGRMDDYLRELVSFCLAHVVMKRFLTEFRS